MDKGFFKDALIGYYEFDLSYIYVLLSRLGVDRVHFVDKLNGHKVSWTISYSALC